MTDLSGYKTSELVDKGYKLKVKYDDAEAQLDEIKKELRERAKKEKQDYFFGRDHFCTVSGRSSTTCDPVDLYKIYRDIDREEDFFRAVSVTIGIAKKDLGETLFDGISHTDTTPYNTVSFKEKTPKKYLKKD